MPVKLKTAGGGSVSLQGHASQSSDTTLTFPNGAGSNTQALTTDGSGNLSWAAAGGGGGAPNLCINGGMRFAQRGSSVTSGTDRTYLVDRFSFRCNQGGGETYTFTQAQSDDTPAGFTHSLKVTAPSDYVDSGYSSSGGTGYQYVAIEYRPEAYDLLATEVGTANAKDITISFWAKSSIAGSYSLGIRHAEDSGQSYGTAYSLAANTWTKVVKTITMSTNSSLVTWETTNGVGCLIDWVLQAEDYRDVTSADTWLSDDKFSVGGQEDWAATSGATFYLTGVKIEIGSSATDFHYEPYVSELAKCERYYQTSARGVYPSTSNHRPTIHGHYYSSSGSYWAAQWPVPMRASPTLTLMDWDKNTGYVGQEGWEAKAVSSTTHTSHGLYHVETSGTFSSTAGYILTANYVCDAEL